MSNSIFNGQSMAFKIECSNPRITLDFVWKCCCCVFNESIDNLKED